MKIVPNNKKNQLVLDELAREEGKHWRNAEKKNKNITFTHMGINLSWFVSTLLFFRKH
jgi:hypothetical protein